MHIVVQFQGRAWDQFAAAMDKLGSGARFGILAQALNEGGAALRQATVAAETAQTGLQQGTIDRAQKEYLASANNLTYTIQASGGNVRLKYFNAKEGGGGVTANPWNRATFYKGYFITSGRQGARRVVLGGHVFRQRGGGGGPWYSKIEGGKSGLYIPTEMTKGRTASTFNAQSSVVLNTIVSRLGSFLP